MQGYVENGWVLVAEEVRDQTSEISEGDVGGSSRLTSDLRPLTSPLGYCISRDRYLKRDELGVIYQLCVSPGHQRSLVGASLIKEVFARSAYGCRLYCCWCAQDLPANHFWESLGFVPIAFRGGSRCRRQARVHIFWQRRIREGDTGERATPWWFPAKTDQGAMREDRIVLPIPPGKHWSDEMPVLHGKDEGGRMRDEKVVRSRARLPKDAPPANGPRPIGARQFGGPSSAPPPVVPQPQPQVAIEKPKREKKPTVKVDPKLVAAARELRDRYLEHVNSEEHALRAMGKYEVSRLTDQTRDTKPIAMLPAA